MDEHEFDVFFLLHTLYMFTPGTILYNQVVPVVCSHNKRAHRNKPYFIII